MSTIFKYINRDEVTHLVLFQNIIRELRRERPDLFTPELEAKITDMIRQGAENEIAWGQYITDDKILGLNNVLIERYIKYLANIRLEAIGLPHLYPEIKENPMWRLRALLSSLRSTFRTAPRSLESQFLTDMRKSQLNKQLHYGGI